MNVDAPLLHTLLVEPGHMSNDEFESLVQQASEQNLVLWDLILDAGFIKDHQLGKLIAEHFDFQFLVLDNEEINQTVLDTIPQALAQARGVIAFRRDEKGVHVGMLNPGDLELRHMVEKRLGEPVIPYMITPTGLREALGRYRAGLRSEMEKALEHMNDPDISQDDRDELTVHIVNTLLEYGFENKVSDIHVEPFEKKILVRFRIDGVMHDVATIPKELADLITTRIKILADMRTDEHRAAQDGKLRFVVRSGGEDINVDVRVSILPVTAGENIVMRLLSSESRRFSLQDLGLGGRDFERVKRAIKHPHGMILVTGPTGSGKTTSLYAVMKILNRREVHIATIEDPVEYDIEGVSQIQVNTRTELTFAKGLRAIVRQDPDIIMVGEIRDEETAGIAVNAAMTGHLVLSTLHTNDAATALPRLLDMGIEPFLVASTVNVIIAQRLVRQVCQRCRASYGVTEEELRVIERDPVLKDIFEKKGYKNLSKMIFFHGSGCDACSGTGYEGRTGIFEVMEIDDDLRDMIKDKADSDSMTEASQKKGMTTMLEDGIDKIFVGQTTFSEVLRVIYESI